MRVKPLPLIAVAALGAAGGYAGWRLTSQSEAKPAAAAPAPAVPVSATTSKMQDVPVYLVGIGTVSALSSVEIHPQVGGILTDLPVREGQDVKKGQVVALIDPRPYKAALDHAQAQLTQDQAQLDNAKLDEQRYSNLATRDFASRQQLDTQVATVAKLQGAVAGDKASIESSQINLDYATVHSPLDGRVSLRRVDPGNLIQANATGPGIISIQQMQPISVIFTLPEEDLQRVRDAMAKGTLAVIADSSDGSRELAHGTLETPDNAINTSTGTIQFRALFPNKDDHLTPGQFVSTRLQVDIAHGVTVPHDAIQHSQDGLFVFTVKPDKTVERTNVKTVYDDGTTSVVTGLQNGTQVVTSGQSRIGPGIAVAVNGTGQAATADTGASQ
jgi:multidrug efflux system membrane fusion protein